MEGGPGTKLVIDHLRGKTRGQRQIFIGSERICIGRHPNNEVGFDVDHDLDASAQHAEIRRRDDGYWLLDVGSSNGTFHGLERITEQRLCREGIYEFGRGGPELRVWQGDAAEPPPPLPAHSRKRVALYASIAVVLALIVVFWLLR